MLPLLFVAVFMCGGYQQTVIDAVGPRVASVGCTTSSEFMYVLATPSMKPGMLWPDAQRIRRLDEQRQRLPRWRGGDITIHPLGGPK